MYCQIDPISSIKYPRNFRSLSEIVLKMIFDWTRSSPKLLKTIRLVSGRCQANDPPPHTMDDPWNFMDYQWVSVDYPWYPLNIRKSPWVGFLWVSVDYTWYSLIIHGYAWMIHGLSMDYQWIAMDCQWMSMDYQWVSQYNHGYPWIVHGYWTGEPATKLSRPKMPANAHTFPARNP